MSEKRTDRRTQYTRKVIKDALLDLLEEKAISTITITDICRMAEINRGTLYLHYKNLSEILDELFDDALNNIDSVYTSITQEKVRECSCGYPLCLFLRKSTKYQPLFFSSELRTMAIERMVKSNEEEFIGALRQQTGQSDVALRALLSFQLNGCFSVCQQLIDLPDDQWETIRSMIDKSLKQGYEALKSK